MLSWYDVKFSNELPRVLMRIRKTLQVIILMSHFSRYSLFVSYYICDFPIIVVIVLNKVKMIRVRLFS